MTMSKKSKESVLSSKISSLINTAPDYGEEDDDLTRAEELLQDESSDSGDEINLAQFRKINIELLDAVDSKYKGVRASRKDIEGDRAFGSDSESENDDGSTGSQSDGATGKGTIVNEQVESLESEISDSDIEVEEGVSDGSDGSVTSEEDSSENENDDANNFQAKVATDVEKGIAIRNQYNIWDALLESRIKFQKCLSIANKLPQANTHSAFQDVGGDDFLSAQSMCHSSVKSVLSSLMELQSQLHAVNTKYHTNNKKRDASSDDEEETNDNEDEVGFQKNRKRRKLSDFADEIKNRHDAFMQFRNDTIQKWNDKTKITQVGNRDFSAFEQSTLKQIETILTDKQRLLKRARTMRTNYHILGEDSEPASKVAKMEECNEIFDDDDFYHQLLRELLERKTTDVTDSVQLSRQWIQLQKVRSKMKKKVDTKASKGRKLRYNVHDKLVNFMMPIEDSTWTDEAKTELFTSIFGKKTTST